MIISWQVDNYFDLTSEQEKWIKEKMSLHLEWHRKEELPKYKKFLIDIQVKSKDGLTMIELNEGFSSFETKRDRIFERLTPDVAFFLTNISHEQIDYFENKILEENEEMLEKLESPKKRLQERTEYFFEQMESWFGKFNEKQILQLNELQNKWYKESYPQTKNRMKLRLKSQNQLLALLRTKPEKKEIEKWLQKWTHNMVNDENQKRKRRILRNKKRILQVDRILTDEQRLHALKEIDYWIEILEQTTGNI